MGGTTPGGVHVSHGVLHGTAHLVRFGRSDGLSLHLRLPVILLFPGSAGSNVSYSSVGKGAYTSWRLTCS